MAIALVITANFAFNRLTPEEEIANQVERKAKQVRAPTPESDPPPPDIEEEELTFEAMVPEGKEFNTPYPLSDIVKEPEKDIEETYNEKLSEQLEETPKKKEEEYH